MDSSIHVLLQELEETGRQNDAHEPDRRKKMLNLERETAHLLSILVRSGRRKHLLEIGTSNGYSTIWLTWATQAFGGHVTSIDREEHKQQLAAKNLQRAGLLQHVDLVCGDATEIVANLQGPFDFVFFDADRFSAPAQLKILLAKLTPNALVLADNALSHPQEIAGYLATLDTLQEFDSLIVPIGKGLSVAYRGVES